MDIKEGIPDQKEKLPSRHCQLSPPLPSPVRYAKFESIRYFIDIDILQNCLIDIDIFQNHHIDIDIFGIALSISIFSKMTISILILISIFFKSGDISTINMSYRYFEQGYLRLSGFDWSNSWGLQLGSLAADTAPKGWIGLVLRKDVGVRRS